MESRGEGAWRGLKAAKTMISDKSLSRSDTKVLTPDSGSSCSAVVSLYNLGILPVV